MKRACVLLAVLAAALMAGCASGLLQPDAAHDVAGLLANYRRVAALTADEQRS